MKAPKPPPPKLGPGPIITTCGPPGPPICGQSRAWRSVQSAGGAGQRGPHSAQSHGHGWQRLSSPTSLPSTQPAAPHPDPTQAHLKHHWPRPKHAADHGTAAAAIPAAARSAVPLPLRVHLGLPADLSSHMRGFSEVVGRISICTAGRVELTHQQAAAYMKQHLHVYTRA